MRCVSEMLQYKQPTVADDVLYVTLILNIVFNVGNYRRSMFGAYQPHYFYHPDNKEGVDKRTLVVLMSHYGTDKLLMCL